MTSSAETKRKTRTNKKRRYTAPKNEGKKENAPSGPWETRQRCQLAPPPARAHTKVRAGGRAAPGGAGAGARLQGGKRPRAERISLLAGMAGPAAAAVPTGRFPSPPPRARLQRCVQSIQHTMWIVKTNRKTPKVLCPSCSNTLRGHLSSLATLRRQPPYRSLIARQVFSLK